MQWCLGRCCCENKQDDQNYKVQTVYGFSSCAIIMAIIGFFHSKFNLDHQNWCCCSFSLVYLQSKVVVTKYSIQRVPHLCSFHYQDFWLVYLHMEDFCFSRRPPAVPLTKVLHNRVFFKSQNSHKAGTLCILNLCTGAPHLTNFHNGSLLMH